MMDKPLIINNLKEVMVIDLALDNLLENLIAQEVSLIHLINNNGKTGFPDYDENQLRYMGDEVKVCKSQIRGIRNLKKKIDPIVDEEI